MKIDYYVFVMNEFGQEDYLQMVAKHHSHIFKNFEFDMSVASKLGKLAIYCKETDKFYNENWEEINLQDKVVFPRCTIPELKGLYDRLETTGATLASTKEDYDIIMDWPKYVSPNHHEVIPTTYGEFLENFDYYKEKYGRVFFKTKYKNISTEVNNVMCLGALGGFKSIDSDNGLLSNESSNEADDLMNSFFSKPMYLVYTSDYGDHNDLRFGSLADDAEVYVEPYLNVVKDWRYKLPIEYRSFVVDGNFVTSRSWVPTTSRVPYEVKELTQEVIDAMPNDMNKTFVVDIMECKDKFGRHYYDLCEINPIACSGYEKGNSIFLLEDIENIDYHYPKVDSIHDDPSM